MSPSDRRSVVTLACYDQARHAVRDTGARRQEGDAHDDVRDPEREADDGDL